MSDTENPLHAMIRNALHDPGKPFGLLTRLRAVDHAAADRLEAVFAPVIAASRQEPGNLTYQVSRDTADPTLFILYDRWASLQAVIDHEASPHFKAGVAQLAGLVAGTPDVTLLLAVGEDGYPTIATNAAHSRQAAT